LGNDFIYRNIAIKELAMTSNNQQDAHALKAIVREKYAQIATQDKDFNAASCCGATEASTKVYNIMMDDYSDLHGYAAEADLGLGCGLPTEYAQISEGDTVLDLGSGAGNDCFVARHLTGPSGKVIGVDFTPAMIEKARANADKLGYNNVEFRAGDLEQLPITSSTIDVIVSNCVLNLVPNKRLVMTEMFRVLKAGGHFSISDVVLEGALPVKLKTDAEMYAGCVAGAMQQAEYIQGLHDAGFINVQIQKRKTIGLPDDLLAKYLSPNEIEAFQQGSTGIFSITVFGQKPGAEKPKIKIKLSQLDTSNHCQPNSGCC
jgi:arsenite methyltransferase